MRNPITSKNNWNRKEQFLKIRLGCEWECKQIVPRNPPRWVTQRCCYEESSKGLVSLGTPFVLTVTFNLSSHLRKFFKKRNSSYFLPFSFALKSVRCPGELNILQSWWQNFFLTANNFSKMAFVKGCSSYKWVGRHMFQKCFSHFFPPFLSSFLFSKSRLLDILSSLHVNLCGWMWWEAVE